MSLVFDSSALLALLRDEIGAALVEELLAEADVPKFAHAANLCEVFYKVALEYGDDAAREDIEDLRRLGIEERGDMDADLWLDAALLIAERRRARKPLALGDAFGVALSRRFDAEFVTADRGELESLAEGSAARILWIR